MLSNNYVNAESKAFPTLINDPLSYTAYSQLSAIGRPVLFKKSAIGGYPDAQT